MIRVCSGNNAATAGTNYRLVTCWIAILRNEANKSFVIKWQSIPIASTLRLNRGAG
jgi:hypothetical protein